MSGAGFADPYSVKVTNGILVTCDSAAKQILLHVDSGREGPSKVILRDVDETHLVIRKEYVDDVNEILQVELEKNTYIQDPDM